MNISYSNISSFNSLLCTNKPNYAYNSCPVKYKQLNADTVSFCSQNNQNCSSGDNKLHTIDKLYTPKYKVENPNKNSYVYMTLVIDKETGEPVPVYVSPSTLSEYEEEYVFYVKEDKNDKFKIIGERSFTIDKDRKLITPGFMQSINNDKYAGLGLRGHQLAVERMMQLGLDNVEISAIPSAYKFHKSCGFETKPNKDDFRIESEGLLNFDFNFYPEIWGIPQKKLRELAVYEKSGDKYIVNIAKTRENLVNYKLEHGGSMPDGNHFIRMQLSQNDLEKWKKRAAEQPIINNNPFKTSAYEIWGTFLPRLDTCGICV